MNWTAEIDSAFGDLLDTVGEPVQWTDAYGVTRVGPDQLPPSALFKRPGTLIMSNMQISDEWAMEYREQDFPGIVVGDVVSIKGMSFRFRDVLQGEDDTLRTARLSRLDNC